MRQILLDVLIVCEVLQGDLRFPEIVLTCNGAILFIVCITAELKDLTKVSQQGDTIESQTEPMGETDGTDIWLRSHDRAALKVKIKFSGVSSLILRLRTFFTPDTCLVVGQETLKYIQRWSEKPTSKVPFIETSKP